MQKFFAKNINIYIPDGEHHGVKVASIPNRIYEAIYIPRIRFPHISDEISFLINKAGLYFLSGYNSDTGKTSIYIGESESCLDRISQHDAQKDFWSTAIVITSSSNSFTKTHIKYFESVLCNFATKAGLCEILNGTVPKEPHVNSNILHEFQESASAIIFLISILGFPVFDKDSFTVPVINSHNVEQDVDSKNLIINKLTDLNSIEAFLSSDRYAGVFKYILKNNKKTPFIHMCPPWEAAENFSSHVFDKTDYINVILDLEKHGYRVSKRKNIEDLIYSLCMKHVYVDEVEKKNKENVEVDTWEKTISNFIDEKTWWKTDEVVLRMGLKNFSVNTLEHRRVCKTLKKMGWVYKKIRSSAWRSVWVKKGYQDICEINPIIIDTHGT